VLELIHYFEEQWLQTCYNWYQGAAAGYPAMNNGIEIMNAVIKRQHTLKDENRELLRRVLPLRFKF